MQKQKTHEPVVHTPHFNLTHLGAWVLIGAAMLSATEMLHQTHNDHGASSSALGPGHSTYVPAEGMTARAEGTRETARLPEEFDIGLRMPAISGS